MTITEAYGFYETDCKIRKVSPASLKLNRYCLTLLRRFLETDDTPVETLTHLKIRDFLIWVAEGKSQSTQSRIYDVLSAIFRFLEREEILERNPMAKVRKPKVPEKVITPLTEEDVDRILSTCDVKTWIGLRNRLIVSLLYDTGIRASELTDLEVDDVDLDQYSILVRHGKGDKSRTVYFGQAVAKLMRRYLVKRGRLRHNRLIVTSGGDPVDRYWLNATIGRLGGRVGLNVHPHLFRHSCGVAMLRAGADVFTVQRLLGHSTLAMTRHYSQMADKDIQEKHRLYSPSDRLKR